jgi:hypothetical protein
MSRKRNLRLTVSISLMLLSPAGWAGDLLLSGTLKDRKGYEYRAQLKLDDYSPTGKGDAVWELNRCFVRSAFGDGLTTSDYRGRLAKWEWFGKQIKIIISGRNETERTFLLTNSPSDSDDLISWSADDAGFDDVRGFFEGRSLTKVNTALELRRSCEDSTENPGVVAVLYKPERFEQMKRYFEGQGLQWYGSPLSAPSGSLNSLALDVPVGAEQNIIQRLKNLEFLYDAGWDYIPKSVPQVGWVLLSNNRMSSESISVLETEVRTLVDRAFPQGAQQINAIPKLGNVFELVMRGPLSRFIEQPKMPGYWIDTKLQLFLVPVASGTRLFVAIRGARLMRWPETGKDDPPEGFGTNLQCESRGDTEGMTTPIAIAQKVLRKASELHNGRDYSAPYC